jgi:hypothetical protein
MKIEITAGGIYGKDGEVPIGTVMDVKDEPKAWAGRYRVVSGGGKDKVAVTNPTKADLKAIHHGGGKFNVVDGDKVLLSGLSKADADAFNEMSAEDKASFVASETAKG